MQKRIHYLLHQNTYFLQFIYFLIVINIVSLILASYEETYLAYQSIFDYIESFSIVIFTIEYLLRIWTANLHREYKGNTAWKKRLYFMTSWLGIIDLLAILPFYLPLFFVFDLRVLRILRLLRLLRVFKLIRYSKALRIISSVLKETRAELGITIFVTFILLILSSTLMYYIEHDAQPEQFASIAHSFWWAVATLTTVGYGDVYPVTMLGKILSAIIALIGIGFVALPTGIISSAFVEKVQEQRQEAQKEKKVCTCPHCGQDFIEDELS